MNYDDLFIGRPFNVPVPSEYVKPVCVVARARYGESMLRQWVWQLDTYPDGRLVTLDGVQRAADFIGDEHGDGDACAVAVLVLSSPPCDAQRYADGTPRWSASVIDMDCHAWLGSNPLRFPLPGADMLERELAALFKGAASPPATNVEGDNAAA